MLFNMRERDHKYRVLDNKANKRYNTTKWNKKKPKARHIWFYRWALHIKLHKISGHEANAQTHAVFIVIIRNYIKYYRHRVTSNAFIFALHYVYYVKSENIIFEMSFIMKLQGAAN